MSATTNQDAPAGPGAPGVPLAWRAGRVLAISPDDAEVWLFGLPGPVRLAGLGSGPLARAVDGIRDLDAVVAAAVAAGMASETAYRIAGKWVASGHLVAIPAPPAPAPLAQVVDWTGGRRAPTLGATAQALADALRAGGLAVRDPLGPGAAAVSVVVVADLLAVDQLAAGEPFLVVAPAGPTPAVTGLLGPGFGCPTCLRHRLGLRRAPELTAAGRVGAHYPPPGPVNPAGVPLLAGAVAAVLGASTRGRAANNQLLVADPGTGTIRRDRVTPVAGCPTCDPGGPVVAATHLTRGTRADLLAGAAVTDSRADGAPGAVGGAHGASGVGGADLGTESSGALRTIDPELTWQRYAHLISPLVGLVPEVIPTGDPQLRAFSAGANAAAVADPVMMRSRLRSSSGGKGLTLSAARTGALAEALERDTLRARGTEPVVRATMAELDRAIHPNDIQLFSHRQLDQVAALLALGLSPDLAGTGFHRVPTHWDTSAEHDWSAVTDITTGARHWLPASLVWFGWPGCPPAYPVGCSNGAAAGNTLTEALLSGLMELVERDSVALWWYPRCHRPAFDLDAWRDPRIEAALAPQRALGTQTWVLDLTADLGIPAAAALSTGLPSAPAAVSMGFGAHVDPVLAVVRALTEMAQMQAPMSQVADISAVDFPGELERDWYHNVTPQNEPWLAPAGLVAPPAPREYQSVAAALGDAIERVTAAGLQVLWADCTRPDIGMPVVRTWVPGLRHFWNRYAPGRLYTVPPKLGWCAGGYGEADLNPRPMML